MSKVLVLALVVVAAAFVVVVEVESFCWEPGTTPFIGPPKTSRLPEGDRILIDWTTGFKDNSNPDCEDVDFMVMMHPKNKPSSYKISDFTLKGQRSTTLHIEKDQDYVFQVIARENKKGEYGIDYKFSDMINNFANGNSAAVTTTATATTRPTVSFLRTSTPASASAGKLPAFLTTTTATPTRTTISFSGRNPPPFVTTQRAATSRPTTPTSGGKSSEKSDSGFDPNPWYIYECIPFLKDVPGFDEYSDDKHNTILVNFVRQMNKKPIEIVEEFLANQKVLDRQKHCSNGTTSTQDPNQRVKGYVVDCEKSEKKVCCPSPWSSDCNDFSVCFKDFKSCDGGRCVHPSWIGDDWPDCLDGSDEMINPLNQDRQMMLPRQLVCVQCAGVVLSAGFMCRESSDGLTLKCVNDVMGHDGACNACVTQYLNIS